MKNCHTYFIRARHKTFFVRNYGLIFSLVFKTSPRNYDRTHLFFNISLPLVFLLLLFPAYTPETGVYLFQAMIYIRPVLKQMCIFRRIDLNRATTTLPTFFLLLLSRTAAQKSTYTSISHKFSSQTHFRDLPEEELERTNIL